MGLRILSLASERGVTTKMGECGGVGVSIGRLGYAGLGSHGFLLIALVAGGQRVLLETIGDGLMFDGQREAELFVSLNALKAIRTQDSEEHA